MQPGCQQLKKIFESVYFGSATCDPTLKCIKPFSQLQIYHLHYWKCVFSSLYKLFVNRLQQKLKLLHFMILY